MLVVHHSGTMVLQHPVALFGDKVSLAEHVERSVMLTDLALGGPGVFAGIGDGFESEAAGVNRGGGGRGLTPGEQQRHGERHEPF